ncbi:MAG: Crp/Fnr family transcriptional regulator [Xenococcaceae cyanobacterium MO_188.B29]|nr:Crp/Fnr family transcriptional regulator [Xenococcaceae cyanobacterium MO_188.B29]
MQKLQQLIIRKDLHLFAADDILPSESCWLIVRGVVKTFSKTEDKKIVTLGYWGAQDLVGKPLSNLNSYYISCVTHVEAIRISSDILSDFSTDIINRAQQQTIWVCIIQTKVVSERLLLLLRWLAAKFSRPVSQGQLIDLRLTHKEIANVIGTNRVTVTRMINKLEQKGLIYRPKQHYIVLCQKTKVLSTSNQSRVG